MPIHLFRSVTLVATIAWNVAEGQQMNRLFETLSKVRGPVQNIHIPKDNVILKTDFNTAGSKTGSLLKKTSFIYLTIEGTGRVYSWEKDDLGQSTFQRIDSTNFEGYNNMSFEFIHRDTLFSLGGYGFWRVNGHLRYFSEGREWYIAPLDRETPFHGSMVYYDSAKGSVYFIQPPFLDEATSQREDNHQVGILDMRNRSGRILGRVRTAEGVQPNRFLFGSQKLGGLVVDDFRSILLLDISANKVWRLRNKNLADRMFANSLNVDPIRFEHDGILYSYDEISDRLDSFPISRNDFEPIGQAVYITESQPDNESTVPYTALGTLAFIALAWGAYRYGIRQGASLYQTKSDEPKQTPANGDKGHLAESGFSSIDVQLIESVHRSYLDGRPFTAQEMNRVIGVARKSLEIQKKMRRESLVRINRRFRDLTGLDADLISSRRSEEDKRYYQYLISPEAWEAYRRIRQPHDAG